MQVVVMVWRIVQRYGSDPTFATFVIYRITIVCIIIIIITAVVITSDSVW